MKASSVHDEIDDEVQDVGEPEVPKDIPDEPKTDQPKNEKKTDNEDFWDTEVPDNEKTVDKASPTTENKEGNSSPPYSNNKSNGGSPPTNGSSKASSRQSSAAGSRQSSPGTKRRSPKNSPKNGRKKPLSSSTIGSTDGSSMSTDATTSATPSGSLFVPKNTTDGKAKNTMNFKTFIMLKRMLKARRPPTKIPESPPMSPSSKVAPNGTAEVIKVEVDVHHSADSDPDRKRVTIAGDTHLPTTSDEEVKNTLIENGGSPKLHKRWDTEDNPTITVTSSDGVTEEITENF